MPQELQAEQLLRAGQLDEAIAALQNQIRAAPADPKLRVFLFQICCVLGQWDRALTQLNIAGDLDPKNMLMVQVCRETLLCEALRSDIFAGKRAPMVFGKPAEWVALLVQASQLVASGNAVQSEELRNRALEQAPAISGVLVHNDQEHPFEWIADADSRLGPILEAVIEGRYFWVPFQCIKEVHLDAPKDLRDVVWAPVQFVWANGGTSVGMIPTRYAGTETTKDAALLLARKTEWTNAGGDVFIGLGQRVLATNADEYPLLEVRKIKFDVPESADLAEAIGDRAVSDRE